MFSIVMHRQQGKDVTLPAEDASSAQAQTPQLPVWDIIDLGSGDESGRAPQLAHEDHKDHTSEGDNTEALSDVPSEIFKEDATATRYLSLLVVTCKAFGSMQ